jgi:hypothetical protein
MSEKEQEQEQKNEAKNDNELRPPQPLALNGQAREFIRATQIFKTYRDQEYSLMLKTMGIPPDILLEQANKVKE